MEKWVKLYCSVNCNSNFSFKKFPVALTRGKKKNLWREIWNRLVITTSVPQGLINPDFQMSSLNHEPEGYTHMNLWVRLCRGDPRPLSLYWFFILLIRHPIPDENSLIPIFHPWKKWQENLAMPFTETVAQLKVPHPPGSFGPQGPEMLLFFNSVSVDVKWNSWYMSGTYHRFRQMLYSKAGHIQTTSCRFYAL